MIPLLMTENDNTAFALILATLLNSNLVVGEGMVIAGVMFTSFPGS